MPTNNGLVTRYSKLVNLQSRRGNSRPPTLVTAVSADRSSLCKSNIRAIPRRRRLNLRTRVELWCCVGFALLCVVALAVSEGP